MKILIRDVLTLLFRLHIRPHAHHRMLAVNIDRVRADDLNRLFRLDIHFYAPQSYAD